LFLAPSPLTRRHHIPSERLVQDTLLLAFTRHVHTCTRQGYLEPAGAVWGVVDRRFKQTTRKTDAPTRARAHASFSPGVSGSHVPAVASHLFDRSMSRSRTFPRLGLVSAPYRPYILFTLYIPPSSPHLGRLSRTTDDCFFFHLSRLHRLASPAPSRVSPCA
jgi:hypothetical protein